jgi:hypothetical protein
MILCTGFCGLATTVLSAVPPGGPFKYIIGIVGSLQFALQMLLVVLCFWIYSLVSGSFNDVLANVEHLTFVNGCSDEYTQINADAYV